MTTRTATFRFAPGDAISFTATFLDDGDPWAVPGDFVATLRRRQQTLNVTVAIDDSGGHVVVLSLDETQTADLAIGAYQLVLAVDGGGDDDAEELLQIPVLISLDGETTPNPSDEQTFTFGSTAIAATVVYGNPGSGASTAAEVTITAGTPAFLDASTVSARFDTLMAGAGGLAGDDVDSEKGVITDFMVIEADDDVESRLGNSARLHEWDVVTRIQDRRRLDTLEDDVDTLQVDVAAIDATQGARLAVARWAEANPQTGRYLEVCGSNTHNGRAFIYDSTLTFTTGSDVRATVMLPDITTLNRWAEILTRTADGAGSWDAFELALWMTSGHDLQVFHEHTRTGGTVEVSPFASGPGPALGVPVRVRQTTVFATGVTNVYVATVDEGDVATSDGQRWLLVGTATDPAGSTSFIANSEPWMIGAGGADVGGHMRIYDLEVRSSVDGTVIARPDIAGTANGAQVVQDDIAGEWDASHGDGVVVVPSTGSGPDLSDATPAALGTASAGVSADASRADHVHAQPLRRGTIHLPYAGATTYSGMAIAAVTNNYWGSSAQNDYMEWTWQHIDAGTYTIATWGQVGTDRGITTVAVDGVSAGTIDWYAGGASISRLTIAGVTVTDGTHTIRLTTSSKHASSSGYVTRLIEALTFIRTA